MQNEFFKREKFPGLWLYCTEIKVSGALGWLSLKSVQCLILAFGSVHDLKFHGIKPHIELRAVSAEPPHDSLSLPVSLVLPCLYSPTPSK